jgi:NNP family nitrate/nitrite transporter-like MFS transporter
MLIAGAVCLLTAVAYFFLTQDTPEGNLIALRKAGLIEPQKKMSFATAAADPRTWCLFVVYAACFGIELTIDNIAHTYFEDHKYFAMAIGAASWAAFSFGGLNIFARALGGYASDKMNARFGLIGRVYWLFVVIFTEGLAMMLFSRMYSAPPMLVTFMFFGLFVCMGCGAVYAIVPFINKDAVGSVSGIVGAGGNVGAVASGFMFGASDWHHSLLVLGGLVVAASFLALGIRFKTDARPAAEPVYAADSDASAQDLEAPPELAGA